VRRARKTTTACAVAVVALLEGPFQRALERALCAPAGQTRVQRINSGRALIATNGGGRRLFRGAKAGTGDLVGYVIPEGWHLEVECKAAGETPSPAQRRRRRALERAGAIYVLVEALPLESQLEESVARAVALVEAAIAARRARA